MIDLSSIVTAPAKPGLLPFALDVGGGSDVPPDAMPSFALTLTDLMAGTAPANAPVPDGTKPATGRQKAAVPGASLPDLGVTMSDDSAAAPAVPDLAQAESDPQSTPPMAVADDPAPDPQLEPALAWLLPPVAPPPPAAPLRLAITVRGRAVDVAAAPEVANDAGAPLTPQSLIDQSPGLLPVPGKTEAKARGRTAVRTPAAPMSVAPTDLAPVAIAPAPTTAVAPPVLPVAAFPTGAPAVAPQRYARTTITSATVRAAALAGVAPPVMAAADATSVVATLVADPAVPATPVIPVVARPGPAAIRPAVVAPPVLAGPVAAPVLSSAAAGPVSANPLPPASAPILAAPASAQPASSPAVVAAAPTTAPAGASPQPVTAATARADRPASLADPRVQSEHSVSVTPPTAARTAAAAPVAAVAVAVEAATPRRADDPLAPAALATPLASTQPIAVAAAGGAQQAGIDLTRDPGLHRMIGRIETLRDNADARDTRIRLIPDSLGPVDVSVRQDGDAVRVHFTATEAATRQLIADAQPRLTELAEARGVRIERATVDGGQPGNSQPGSYQAGGQQSASADTGQPRPHTSSQPQPGANRAPAPASADPDESIDDRIA